MPRYNPYKLFVGAFVPNWILERTELSAGAKLVFGRLCQYAGEKGEAWPKQETLASEIGLSKRQVKRYVAELRHLKLIEITKIAFGAPSHYVFLIHPWMKNYRSNRATYVPLIGPHMSPPLKRIIQENHQLEENHPQDLNQSLDDIIHSPRKLKNAAQGIRAASALNFGRLSRP